MSLVLTSLAEHEAVIEKGLASFLDVGNALIAIKADQLYKTTHATFEDYCQERWGIGRSTGYQLIVAATTVEALIKALPSPVQMSAIADISNAEQVSPDGDTLPGMSPSGNILLPVRESQVRPLTRLRNEPLDAANAWTEAVAEAKGEQPTAAQVERAVEKRLPKQTPERQQQEATLAKVLDDDEMRMLTIREAMSKANLAISQKYLIWSPEKVAAALDEEHFDSLLDTIDALNTWHLGVEAARPRGLRIVKGSTNVG